MFFTVDKDEPEYTDVVELDLSTVEASLSGPKRPQDLIFLSDMKKEFEKSVTAPVVTKVMDSMKVNLIRKQLLTLKMVRLQK